MGASTDQLKDIAATSDTARTDLAFHHFLNTIQTPNGALETRV